MPAASGTGKKKKKPDRGLSAVRPFTSSGAYGYDIAVHDVTGASGIAVVPASVMNDRFNIEVYTRNSQYGFKDLEKR